MPQQTQRTRPLSIGGENELTRVATLRDMVGTSTATYQLNEPRQTKIPGNVPSVPDLSVALSQVPGNVHHHHLLVSGKIELRLQ